MLTEKDKQEFEHLRKLAECGELSPEDKKVFRELRELAKKPKINEADVR